MVLDASNSTSFHLISIRFSAAFLCDTAQDKPSIWIAFQSFFFQLIISTTWHYTSVLFHFISMPNKMCVLSYIFGSFRFDNFLKKKKNVPWTQCSACQKDGVVCATAESVQQIVCVPAFVCVSFSFFFRLFDGLVLNISVSMDFFRTGIGFLSSFTAAFFFAYVLYLFFAICIAQCVRHRLLHDNHWLKTNNTVAW